jgi:hypothetical protein
LAPGLLHETVHHVLHNCGASAVERVAGLACLEKRVGILRRAAENGPVRGHGALAMLAHEFVIHHRAKIVIAHRAIMFTTCEVAEAVKEVQKRNARFQRRSMPDARQIARFLDGV